MEVPKETPELITKMCKDCLYYKPIEKFQAKTRVCISCRNKKYYNKKYFQDYYQNNSEKIYDDAIRRYQAVEKVKHPLPIGRPRKLKEN